MEHTNRKKGGPPRHLHHNEDKWFYAIEGEYIVEVESERFRLKSGILFLDHARCLTSGHSSVTLPAKC